MRISGAAASDRRCEAGSWKRLVHLTAIVVAFGKALDTRFVRWLRRLPAIDRNGLGGRLSRSPLAG